MLCEEAFFSKLKLFWVLCCFPPTVVLCVLLEMPSFRCRYSRRLDLAFGNTQVSDRNIILFSSTEYLISAISLLVMDFTVTYIIIFLIIIIFGYYWILDDYFALKNNF